MVNCVYFYILHITKNSHRQKTFLPSMEMYPDAVGSASFPFGENGTAAAIIAGTVSTPSRMVKKSDVVRNTVLQHRGLSLCAEKSELWILVSRCMGIDVKTDWYGRRESNSRHELGRLLRYHYATPAFLYCTRRKYAVSNIRNNC